MKISVFLIGIALTALMALACLMAILVYLEPSSSDFLIMFLFYLSLFISVSGFLSFVGLLVRRLSRKSKTALSVNRQLWDSFRQGILLAIILVGALLLQSKSLIYWWSLLILVGGVGLIEFLSLRRI